MPNCFFFFFTANEFLKELKVISLRQHNSLFCFTSGKAPDKGAKQLLKSIYVTDEENLSELRALLCTRELPNFPVPMASNNKVLKLLRNIGLRHPTSLKIPALKQYSQQYNIESLWSVYNLHQ